MSSLFKGGGRETWNFPLYERSRPFHTINSLPAALALPRERLSFDKQLIGLFAGLSRRWQTRSTLVSIARSRLACTSVERSV